MLTRKIIILFVLIAAICLSGCNLSQSGAADEVALNPPTLSIMVTNTVIPSLSPTRTALAAAPTITVLDSATQPPPQIVKVAAAATQPPPSGVCSLKAAGDYEVNIRKGPGTQHDIISALSTGQYMLVIGRADNGWLQIAVSREQVGWVSPKVTTLYGSCGSLTTTTFINGAANPTLTPTPTAIFGADIGTASRFIVTTSAVGNITAGTAVRISTARFTGSDWLYDIVTADGRTAVASQAQLAFSSTAGLFPFPTATPFIWTATAAAPIMELPGDVSASDVVIPPDLCTVTAHSTTNLYASPGSSTVVGVLKPGPWAQVGAVNADGWYKVTIWTDGRQGWTTLGSVELHGPCGSLPVE